MIIKCHSCDASTTSHRLPGESWGYIDEPGWAYFADGKYFCPKCCVRKRAEHEAEVESKRKLGRINCIPDGE